MLERGQIERRNGEAMMKEWELCYMFDMHREAIYRIKATVDSYLIQKEGKCSACARLILSCLHNELHHDVTLSHMFNNSNITIFVYSLSSDGI